MTTVLLQWLKMQKLFVCYCILFQSNLFLLIISLLFSLVRWPRNSSDWKWTVGSEIWSLKLPLGKYVEKRMIRDVLLRIWEKENRRFLSFLEKSTVRISDSWNWMRQKKFEIKSITEFGQEIHSWINMDLLKGPKTSMDLRSGYTEANDEPPESIMSLSCQIEEHLKALEKESHQTAAQS